MNWVRHFLLLAFGLLMAGITLTLLAFVALTILLQRGPLEIPQLHSFIEDGVRKKFYEHSVEIGSVSIVSIDTGAGNRILLRNVIVSDVNGVQLVAVPEMIARFSILDLFYGRLAPNNVSIVGSELNLKRDKQGVISFLGAGSETVFSENLLPLLDIFGNRADISTLNVVELLNTKITFYDQITDETWVSAGSELSLKRNGRKILGRAVFQLEEGELDSINSTSLILNASYILESETASMSIQFSDAESTSIADFFNTFDWLRNLDANLSGSIRAQLARDGKVGHLHGVLEMADGRLVDTPEGQPITFSTAKVYFDFDSYKDELTVSQLDFETSSGSGSGSGVLEFTRDKLGGVSSLVGQLRFGNILIKRPDLFDKDVAIREVALDARISFWPLKIDVGQLAVFDGDTVIKMSGSSEAGKAHWISSYDLDIDRISVPRLKELWPKTLVNKTRKWVRENVFSGMFTDVVGGLRVTKGQPNYALNFSFEKSNFNFLDTVPNLQDGDGFGYLTENDLRLDMNAGYVVAPNGTKVDISGSGLFVPNTNVRPTPGEVTFKAHGDIEAALGLLNVEKFRFLDKFGLKPNLGKGAVSISGLFKLPLSAGTKKEDVELALDAELLNVYSTDLIEDRTITARRLAGKITDQGVTLTGDVKIDTIPVNVTWTQSFDQRSTQSKIDAHFNLSDKNLKAFDVEFPDGILSGSTPAHVAVNLRRGSPSKFKLSSNLVGANINIPALNWSKDENSKGQLTIIGSLGQQVDVDNLVFQAPGFETVGSFDFDAKNRLQRARLRRLNIGKWLSTSAVIKLRADGHTDISLNGGTADLRYFNRASSSEKNRLFKSKINLNLERVRVNNDLSLTEVTGQLSTKGGLKGAFVGRVNGSTQIEGQLFPQKSGTAIELNSKNAGGVLASSKLLNNAREGVLRIVLIPREDDANYDGILEIQRIRFKDASALAALLNGISLVGALQQLEGEGIHFSNIEGQFKLRNNGVKLEKISAVGPSMGMTLDGWYNTRTKDVDFEGVITPFYAVNGVFERIFGQLVGRRKGEGMFSFTYRMRGQATAPDVVVNPLSILTPGAFREIFRQKPPVSPSK